MLALDVDVAVVTERRARPPRDLRLAGASCDEVFRAFLARPRRRSSWDAPELLALRRRPVAFDARGRSCSSPAARASPGAATRSRSPSRARTTRATPPRRSRPPRSPAPPTAARGRRARDLRRRRPALRARSGRRRAGALVVDDYAHHPTEVAATIAAARTLEPRRVVAVFQPHLYSRTPRPAPRVRRRARRAPTSPSCSTSTRRASAPRTSRASSGRLVAEAAADAAGGRAVLWLPALRRRRARAARRGCAPATCCSSWAPATSTRSAAARRLSARSERAPRGRRRLLDGRRRRPRPRRLGRMPAPPPCRGSAASRACRGSPSGPSPSLALLIAGWLWLRDSSLVASSTSRSPGSPDPRPAASRAALEAAARDMTTLHVDADALRDGRRAVPGRPGPRGRAPTSRTACRSRSIERVPVAVVDAGGEQTSPSPPTARSCAARAQRATCRRSGQRRPRRRSRRRRRPRARPSPPSPRRRRRLRDRVAARVARPSRAASRSSCTTARTLRFGDADRLAAKWAAAAAVLGRPRLRRRHLHRPPLPRAPCRRGPGGPDACSAIRTRPTRADPAHDHDVGGRRRRARRHSQPSTSA